MGTKFYVRHPDQWPNVEEFSLVTLEMADVEFFQPAPVSAPWHWQAIVNSTTFNFWPHVGKWNVETEKSRYGMRQAKEALQQELSAPPFGPLVEDD